MYIAVSGNLGSGKTTLAKGLARQFRCPFYPITPYDESYISDLFEQAERWTFEAQASFLLHKYNEIKKGLADGKLFVLDRTIYEDVEVFARKFHDDGVIDARSMELLEGIYRNLLASLPAPSIILWCACPPEICAQRLAQRPRRYQDRYPQDHLAKLDSKLALWLRTISKTPLLQIDTATIDFRQEESIRMLAYQIDQFVRNNREYDQPDLFFPSKADSSHKSSTALFNVVNSPERNQAQFPAGLLSRPKVYLAAPFTSMAQKRSLLVTGDQRLFLGDEYIDSVGGPYRKQLANLARAIESHGYRVLLPHRDINAWGKKAYPASEIADKCIEAVAGSDYFVGLIAESFGSHLELGVALGMSKPTLLLFADGIPTSFFGKGVMESGRVKTLRGRSVSELISKIRTRDILSTL
jgi:deoxyadenosine/deoxycytidine kinase